MAETNQDIDLSSLPITPTVGCVIVALDKVLLVRHVGALGPKKGVYGLPAGKIEIGETELLASCREVLEETGLFVHPDMMVMVPKMYGALITRQDGTRLNCTFRVFATKYFSGKLADSEETHPEWIPIDKVKDLDVLPDLEEIIAAGLLALEKA